MITPPPLILDGGLATELERRGHKLGDALWSARLLQDDPAAIRAVHRDYLEAGADCLTSAGYQASLPGWQAHGVSAENAATLITRAVTLACEARADFLAHHRPQRPPLVAASVGPYGAYLANGAEYSGAYDLEEAGLVSWHAPRWELLATTSADWLACETIPSFAEVRALARLLATTPRARAWFSLTCRDAGHMSDGTPLATCAAWLDRLPQVVAIGVNCVAPDLVLPALTTLRRATSKPLIAYPNAGEGWDAAGRLWVGHGWESADFAAQARAWHHAGAQLIGGCCRTTPDHIRALRAAFAPPLCGTPDHA